MSYKYVNKLDQDITVEGITVLASGGYFSSEPVAALDPKSDGLQFDRYINGFLSNVEPVPEPVKVVAAKK